jgi:hypothetical protein
VSEQTSPSPESRRPGFTSSNASTAAHDDLHECGACFRPCGTVVRNGVRMCQSCTCRRAPTPPDDTRRATAVGYDVDQVVTLCTCCGLGVLRDGSHWTVWFCVSCKARVRRLHEEYDAYLIPDGRHSLHGGFGRRGRAAFERSEVRAFAAVIGSIAHRTGRVDTWATRVVQQHLATFGFNHGSDVSPLLYLDKQTQTDAARGRAFRGLCAWLGAEV